MQQSGAKSLGFLLACWLVTATVTLGQGDDWPADRGLILRGDLVTMDGALKVIDDGRLVIVGEKIVGVLKPGDSLPAGIDLSDAIQVNTDGWIFPGLIDAHNHVSYNVLPLYEVPQKYANRYQWTSPASYKRLINSPKKLLTSSSYYGLEPEVIKYAEVKAISGGVTSIQGTPDLAATRSLVRNIENSNFGQDRIYQHGLAIDDSRFQDDLQEGLLKQMAEGKVDAFLIHLAEGTDTKSRGEFATLKSLGLLGDMTGVIHGTALEKPDFEEMAAAGTKLVWSPLSNLLLYGKTTNVPAAIDAGVVVCLGADWSPSGCKNLLGELKVANEVDRTIFGDKIGDAELVRMVTSNPALALGLDDKIGRLATGMYADVAVFAKADPDPYRSLIKSTEKDVKLVLVGGEPYWGDRSLMATLKPGDFEVLVAQGVEKAVDVKDPALSEGSESFAQIRSTLEQAMLFDMEHMWQTFGQGEDLDEFTQSMDAKFPEGLVAIPLDPLFAGGDEEFFHDLAGSTIANLQFDLAAYWGAGTGSTPDLALLAFVNGSSATLEVLDVGVALDSRAARNIVEHRNGPDKKVGTGDDNPYDDVAELDAVPYVGNSVLEKLRAYVAQASNPDAPVLAFLNSASTTIQLLDVDVGLDQRAAVNIVVHRNGTDGLPGNGDDDPFDSMDELDQVEWVGASAIGKIREFVQEH